MDPQEPAIAAYEAALDEYLQTRNEQALFRASLLSQHFVESGLGPDDIIALHFEALEHALALRVPREQARAVGDAHQFLLEVMIAYGVKYKEYLELKLRDSLREAEARAELEQQRALEAERVEREKAELLAGIAHELRTPITAAKGNLDLAVRRLSSGQTDTLAPLLGLTREALDRLSRLTGDLVQISRGEMPQLDRAPQDITEILEQACLWARPTAATKGVDLTLETRQPILLLCNPDALLSVFGNLLSNAVRYTPSGGSVRVSHGLREGEVWVEVRDTGIGIPPEVQARIFEKFYRGDDARRMDVQGLGLGLTLVQQMVQAHRGRIELESEPARGSAF
ncbi:MAG TPA: HAMP domain-containing sensor histidine kinase, partial [Thermomicrobiaceae bacterium]|nr:HAMP domain-containing sensor histidine kinase [Thermomicrobiaceae bacterium]